MTAVLTTDRAKAQYKMLWVVKMLSCKEGCILNPIFIICTDTHAQNENKIKRDQRVCVCVSFPNQIEQGYDCNQ
jgi:hypothetical protein